MPSSRMHTAHLLIDRGGGEGSFMPPRSQNSLQGPPSQKLPFTAPPAKDSTPLRMVHPLRMVGTPTPKCHGNRSLLVVLFFY